MALWLGWIVRSEVSLTLALAAVFTAASPGGVTCSAGFTAKFLVVHSDTVTVADFTFAIGTRAIRSFSIHNANT